MAACRSMSTIVSYRIAFASLYNRFEYLLPIPKIAYHVPKVGHMTWSL